MFKKFEKTNYPPKQTPMLIWDGECGFCKYWVTRWKMKTGETVNYKTYQEVAHQFEDIPIKEFKKASRLIDLDGNIYSGPDSAYKSYTYGNGTGTLHSWYHTYSWFSTLSDNAYNFIAKNRSVMFKITKALLGNNPKSFIHYWIIYVALICIAVYFIITQ